MESKQLLLADQARNSAFDNILHGNSTKSTGGIRAMINKNNSAHIAAVGEYFRHWDNKKAEDETQAIRQARTDDYSSLTRQ